MTRSSELSVEIGADHVATVEFDRPPSNHFDAGLIEALADAYESLDADPACRAIVLCSAGRHFCAGADFGREPAQGEDPSPHSMLGVRDIYRHAVRIFAARTPVVAAVQGAAVGGGLGLALSADFRVAAPDARFVANFARLGIHHGFGLTETLPDAVGRGRAIDLLYTGRRVDSAEALAIGLVDRVAETDSVRDTARQLGAEIAASAPLAVQSIRETMRGDLAERVRRATEREAAEQAKLMETSDFVAGVAAVAERRPAEFTGT